MTLLKLLAGAGLAYAALVGGVYLFQSHLLYLPEVPSRTLAADPGALGLDFQDVALETADGVALHGWYVPAPGARRVLLFFHGNAGNISHRLDSIQIFHDLGLDVLIIDYRGYGRSEGSPSEQGTYRDAEAAWRYLAGERGLDPGRVVVFGRSLGAAVAAWLAARHPPGALILESAFRSVPAMAAELYPWLPVRWLARLRYETQAYVGQVTAPVLVVHSTDDEIVPFTHGQAVYDAAREPKTLLRLRGGHNDGFMVSADVYRAGLAEFLRQLPAPPAPGRGG